MAVRRQSSTRSSDPAARRHRSIRVPAVLGTLVLTMGLVQGGVAYADPPNPIAVGVTASPNPVASGQQLTYTIVVTNTGGAKVTNVVVTDQINGVGVVPVPPGLPQLTLSSSKGSCVQGGPNGNLVTCDPGDLAGGESVTITIGGQVTAANGTVLHNTATATGTKSAQNFTTSGTVSVSVSGGTGTGPQPDLAINKTGPTNVAPGGDLTYTLTVNNLGTANTSGVRVVDTLPAGVTLKATPFSTTSLFTCADSAGPPVTVTCDGGTVNAGQNGTITIYAVAPASGTLTNTAVVDPDDAIVESNELNNTSASVNTTVSGPPPEALLTIVKTDGSPDLGVAWDTGAGPDPVNPGQQLTYKIQVTNNATTRADDVVISDGTQGLEAASITASQVVSSGTVGRGGGCTVNAPNVTCKVRTLNPGGTVTVTIIGYVVATAGGSLFNTATVNGNIKNTGVTDTDSEVTTVRPSVDLTVTKGADPQIACARTWPTTTPDQHLAGAGGVPPAAGDIPAIGLVQDPVCLGGLTYSFVVGNSGNDDATSVVVRDPLPAGVIFDSFDTDGGFTCAVNASNVVTCTGGTIPAAETRNLRFRVVTPASVGTLTNTVTVDPNNSIFEADETNNGASVTSSITTGIDLVVWKADKEGIDPPGGAAPLTEGFDSIATNGTATTTVIVDNVGTQNATGITVVDTLPAGTRFLSVTSDQGFTCSHDGSATGGKVTCNGGYLLGTMSEFYDPAGPAAAGPGDDFATITIKYFATSFVQPAMHNLVEVDPFGVIPEVNELNNSFVDDTVVTVGNDDKGAFNQLTVQKSQTDPSVGAGDPDATVATNGTLVYRLLVSNLGTDPVSSAVVQDFLPTGSRFISAVDTNLASSPSDSFLCTHDGSATGGTVTCTGGALSGTVNTIPSGGGGDVPTSRTVEVRVYAPNVPGSYQNVAKVDPDGLIPEGNEFDNTSTVTTVVTVGGNNMFNELTISKEQTDPAGGDVATSSVVTYEVEVSNTGSDPAFGVRVTDTLPAGFTFISALDTSGPADPFRFVCTPAAGNTIDCTGATLSGTVNAAGTNPTSRTIVIKAFSAAAPGTYTNTVVVDPANAIPEGNETNNFASTETDVLNGGPGKYIDLEIDKTQQVPDPDTTTSVPPGSQITYQLHVSNSGVQDAFNVTVRDALPEHVTLDEAKDSVVGTGDFSCASDADVVTCTGGTIPAGGSRDIIIKVTVVDSIEEFAVDPSDVTITLTNSAIVDPDNTVPEGEETNNVDMVSTSVKPVIDLTVTKDGPKTASQNDIAEYVITVTNTAIGGGSGATAYGVHVVDSLPIGLIPLSVEATPSNFNCALFENPVNYVDCVGDLEPGDANKVTITISVFVTADGGPLDNEACVDPGQLVAESNEINNCVTQTTDVTPPAPKLLMNKSADTSSVTVGQQFTYTLNVSNVGDGPTTSSVQVTDSVPEQVTVLGVNPDAAFDCSASSGNEVDCTLSDPMNPGDSASIQVVVEVDADVTDLSFTNTAEATGGGSDPSSASVTTFLGGSGVDLVLASVDDLPDPVAVGSLLTYQAVVVNNGTDDVASFEVTQTFDDTTGLTFQSAVGSEGFTCSYTSPTVTCTGGLLAGASTTLTIRFTAGAGAVPSVTSVVTVDPSDAVDESDDVINNTLDVTTTVNGDICQNCIDLALGPVLAAPDPFDPGDDVVWNFDVANIGDLASSTDPAPNSVVVLIDVDTSFNDYTSLSINAPGYTCVGGAKVAGDATPEYSCSVANVAAGAGTVFSVTATAEDTPYLGFAVAVDPTSQITEFNEANNSGSRTVNRA